MWSHLKSTGRLQLSGADLRGHNNIPGFVLMLQCVLSPSCICSSRCSFYVSRCKLAEDMKSTSGDDFRSTLI